MEIRAEGAGKKFGKDWIFKNFDYQFQAARRYAILGANGSGKSTLLMALCGYYQLNKGNVRWFSDAEIKEENWYSQYALCSPMMELPEELTIEEFLHSHFELKPLKADWSIATMLEMTHLKKAAGRYLRQLSSGQRQRIKLLAALGADVPVVFLDEPCTNLDQEGIQWYRQLVENLSGQLLMIASNMEVEYAFCEHQLRIEDLR